jgi:hypothetical protein
MNNYSLQVSGIAPSANQEAMVGAGGNDNSLSVWTSVDVDGRGMQGGQMPISAECGIFTKLVKGSQGSIRTQIKLPTIGRGHRQLAIRMYGDLALGNRFFVDAG